MAIGSGLAGSFGVASETTYGTYAAPTRFYEPAMKSEIKKVKTTVQGGGLAAGRMVQPGSRRVVVTEAGTGSVDLEVTRTKMGLLLQHIFGGSATPTQQAATTAYLQAHALADNVGNYLTAQNGVPDTGGTVRPYTGKGGKVTSAEFSCGAGELLTLALELDFQKVSEVESLAAPSFATGLMPFHFNQMSVKLGTFGAEASVGGVKKASVKLERGQYTDAFYAGALGLKANPLMNDFVKVSGSIDADFLDKTVFADRFASDGSIAMVVEWLGPVIASTYYSRLTLKIPQVFFDGDTPILDGPNVVSGSFPFVAQFDETNATITAEYMSTDTTV